MFGDFDERFRQIEHLTPLDPHSHRRALGAAAMATGRSLVRHDPVGLGDLAKGFALVPFLAPARTTRGLAKAHRLLSQPIARRRLRTRRTVHPQPPAKLRILNPQRFHLPLKRCNQSRHFRWKNHPARELWFAPKDSPQRPKHKILSHCDKSHPPGGWAVTKNSPNRRQPVLVANGVAATLCRPLYAGCRVYDGRACHPAIIGLPSALSTTMSTGFEFCWPCSGIRPHTARSRNGVRAHVPAHDLDCEPL